MKTRILTCITAITLFAAVAIPFQLAAQKHATHFRHYKLIDIGTFGGPASNTQDETQVINSRGIVAGARGIAAG